MRTFPLPSLRAFAIPAMLAMPAAACVNPKDQANMVQAINAAADEVGALRSDVAQLRADVDSLQAVVAHQDTVITRITAVYNIPR